MEVHFYTQRLLVREFKLSDLPTIYDYASRSDVSTYSIWEPSSYKEAEESLFTTLKLAKLEPRIIYEFAIELLENGHHIGGCALVLNEKNSTEATIGYIINPKYWNRGYATEATKGLLIFASYKLNLTTIRATCDIDNKASRRVLQKCDFVLEQTIENDFIQKGKMRNTQVFIRDLDIYKKENRF